MSLRDRAPSLDQLLDAARDRVMTPAELEAQRRSFAFGNVSFGNPRVTRELVDRVADRLTGERMDMTIAPGLWITRSGERANVAGERKAGGWSGSIGRRWLKTWWHADGRHNLSSQNDLLRPLHPGER